MNMRNRAEMLAKKVGGYDPDMFLRTSDMKKRLTKRLNDDTAIIIKEFTKEKQEALERFSIVFCRGCKSSKKEIGTKCPYKCSAYSRYSSAILGFDIEYMGE